MKAILFTNIGNATQACNLIDQNQRKLAKDAGFTVDDNGDIISKDGNGNDVPNAQKTVRWDVPHPVGTGTTTPAGSFTHWIIDPRPVRGDAIMDQVQNWTEGEYQYPPDPNAV